MYTCLWHGNSPLMGVGWGHCSFLLYNMCLSSYAMSNFLVIPPLHRSGVYCFICVRLSFRPSQDIFRRIFLSNYWWQKSDIWSQASYRYAILWEAFLDPSDSYFLFAELVGFYTHWTYMRGYHKWALAHSSSCFNLVNLRIRRIFKILDLAMVVIILNAYFYFCWNYKLQKQKLY